MYDYHLLEQNMKQGTSGTTDLLACVCVCMYLKWVVTRDISFSLNSFWFFCLFSFGSFGSFGSRACVDVFVHVLFLLFPIYISFIRGT